MNDTEVALDPWRWVHNAVRTSILSGEYPAGSRLVEQQLADRFGTSRGPVRTALHELERTGLVVSVDRRGTFVRSLSDTDVEEIFSLWEVLTEFVMRRAVARIGPSERKWLKQFKARIAKIDQPGEFLEEALEFTRQLYRMAKHSRALEIFESLLVQSQARSLFDLPAEKWEYWDDPSRDFGPICDALLRGDADAAIEASDAWIRQSRSYWLAR